MNEFQTAGAVIAVALLFFQFLHILHTTWRWPMSRLWPSRDGWSAACIPTEGHDPREPLLNWKNAWQGGAFNRWSQMREMRVGDYYQFHIVKPRVITRIEAISEGYRYPKRYKLHIKRTDKPDWEEVSEYDAPIDVTLSKPTKLIGIKFTITEPRLEPKDAQGRSPAWSIYDIRLTEVRLFGCCVKMVIPE